MYYPGKQNVTIMSFFSPKTSYLFTSKTSCLLILKIYISINCNVTVRKCILELNELKYLKHFNKTTFLCSDIHEAASYSYI